MSLTKHGTFIKPANLEALKRLSPAINSYLPVSTSCTIRGCKIPFLRIDSVNSPNLDSSNSVLACEGLSLIDVISIQMR